MAIRADINYINKLSEIQSDKLPKVDAISFLSALQRVFGDITVDKVIKWISNPNTAKQFQGMEAFRARFSTALNTEGTLGGEDQKYIADIAFRILNGQLKSI